MHRRDVLKLAAAAPLAYAGQLWAAPQASTRLLVVFLRGAYDAANVVIPVGSDFYYEARPNIHIARPAAGDDNAALPLDSDWGLHPGLKDSIYPLWKKGQVAFVPYAGAGDDLSRSHFETQDTIELGQPVQGSRDYRSGFLSRLYGQLTSQARPIAFTGEMPLSFRGGRPVANVMIDGPERSSVEEHQAQLIQQMYQGHALAGSVAQGFQMRQDVDKALSSDMMAASRGAGSARGWALATVGDSIFVAGTSNTGSPNDPSHLLLLRLDGQEGRKLWSHVETKVANGSGRALAMVGSGRPRLYVAGTAGSPVGRARIGQLDDSGKLVWSLEPPARPGARAEGALALAFRGPGDGYAAGFSFNGTGARLLVSRLTA